MSVTPANSPTLDRLADAVAARVLPRLLEELATLAAEHRPPSSSGLVDAATLAEILGVNRGWVYANADLLGADRLGASGDGRKPRLRFDIKTARQALASHRAERTATPAPARARAPHRQQRGTDLLPIRGKTA